MKRLKLFSLALFIALFSLASVAQAYEFRALAVGGKVYVVPGGKALKPGAKLDKGQAVKLAKNSYASLAHKSGKIVELKKAGVYKINALLKNLKPSKSSVASRFANYLADEIGESGDMLANADIANNMNVTGSVERSLENQPFVRKSKIKLNFPRKIHLISPVCVLAWEKLDGAKEYEFVLTDRFDKPVFRKKTKASSITLNADELKLERDAYYFWKVVAYKDGEKAESDDACLLVLSDKKAKAIQDTVQILEKELGGENKAAAQIILATFYEQNYLLDQAKEAYQKATQLAPDVAIYQNLFARFRRRMNIDDN